MDNKSINDNDPNYTKYNIKLVEELIPGEIILHPIYRSDGLMLVNRYTVLSPSIIRHMDTHLGRHLSIITVSNKEALVEFINEKIYASQRFIEDLKLVVDNTKKFFKSPSSIQAYVDERVNLQSYSSKNQIIRPRIETEEYTILVKNICYSPLWISMETNLESQKLQIRSKVIRENLINKIYLDKTLLSFIKSMKEYDENLLMHSVNTTCIALIIGLTLELTDKDLIDLSIAALFCNVGYINIDKTHFNNLINGLKPSRFESEHIKNSVEVISTSPYCRNKNIIMGILDHHEYYNGEGNPQRKKEKEISLFGRILSIATSYDDMVLGYYGDAAVISNNALYLICENRERKFDPNILRLIIHRMNVYKIGQTFIHSSNEKGVIIGFSNYAEAPHQPIVKFQDGYIKDYYKQDRF
jgi:HD-GYP domain-containing protein (c-di-GMP phosphodiesterase class II)